MSWRARLVTAFEEVRFVVNKAPNGAGLREYVSREYNELRVLNPGVRIHLHERDVPDAEVYLLNKNLDYVVVKANNLSSEELAKKLGQTTHEALRISQAKQLNAA